AGDRAQPPLWPGLGEDLAAVVGPAGQIGLSKARLDLAAVDHAQIFDRAGCRLRHRYKAGHTAIAAVAAGWAARRAGNRAGDGAADLEEAAAGRGGADPEETRLGRGRGDSDGRD